MSERHEDELPSELADVASRLVANRDEATSLELDAIKTRAMAKARKRRGLGPRAKGVNLRSRVVTLALTALLIGGTTAGGLAVGNGNGNGGAAQSQYRPGLGCGDQNHTHTGPPGNPGKTCK